MFVNLVNRLWGKEPMVAETLQVGSRTVPLIMVRNPRARRYLLRIRPDGTARVTIPRGGSRSEAQAFVERSRSWIARHLEKIHAQLLSPAAWTVGTEIPFRGEQVRITLRDTGGLWLGNELLPVPTVSDDLRPAIEGHLRALATVELPARVQELATQYGLPVRRVTIRNQRGRWGSCSRHGAISLNWRLIQMPAFVRDYIILHELAHLLELNHSKRFWREVERLCPDYRVAEHWLKAHRQLLR